MTQNFSKGLATGAELPSFSLQCGKEGATLRVAGAWTAQTLNGVEKSLRKELRDGMQIVGRVDCSDLTRLDTAGALLLCWALSERGAIPGDISVEDPEHLRLITLARSSLKTESLAQSRPGWVASLLNEIGRNIVVEGRVISELLEFLGEYIVTVFRVIVNPRRVPITSLTYHMEHVGITAVPIVALLSFLIGLVIAYMGAQQLTRLGAEFLVVNLVEITTLRELGVLLTSIVVAGRSGSSFTAEIGAMKANQEVDAMRTMGLSPVLKLAFPRITALIIMLPALVFLADIMGILGGGVAVWGIMGMSPSAYAVRMQEAVQMNNVIVGIFKAPFFALVIGAIGCFHGFRVTGSAESVGRLTTRAVVESIFAVIFLDAMFALFFRGIGV